MKFTCELVRDHDGSYYANLVIDGKPFDGLPENVPFNTLRNAINARAGIVIPRCKDLTFEKLGRKSYAMIDATQYRKGKGCMVSLQERIEGWKPNFDPDCDDIGDSIPAMKLKAGDAIQAAGATWSKIGNDQNGNVLMLSDRIITETAFGDSNDYTDSPVRKLLDKYANAIRKELGANAVMPVYLSLLSLDGLEPYRWIVTDVAMLTYDMYRSNRRKIKPVEPDGTPYWLATPATSECGATDTYAVCINKFGGISLSPTCQERGIRPFFVLKVDTRVTVVSQEEKE